jgi:hypothetical protein
MRGAQLRSGCATIAPAAFDPGRDSLGKIVKDDRSAMAQEVKLEIRPGPSASSEGCALPSHQSLRRFHE